jgi:hypothetical protein
VPGGNQADFLHILRARNGSVDGGGVHNAGMIPLSPS